MEAPREPLVYFLVSLRNMFILRALVLIKGKFVWILTLLVKSFGFENLFSGIKLACICLVTIFGLGLREKEYLFSKLG